MPFKAFQINKKAKKHLIFATLFFSFFSNVCSQLKVTMPVERSVFQRVNNVASIHIGGNIPSFVDQIQARIMPLQGGEAIDWKRIDTSIGGGAFIGELTYVKGGWYSLEVRAMLNGNQVGDISTVSKVGVGEVFIISGQSNAQGGHPPQGGFYDNTKYGAQDDRVNCIDFFDSDELSLPLFPQISQLKAETSIAPHGHASWCWGVLGDKIAKELNVPVLFFNSAEGGTRMHQWEQAARGLQVNNAYSGQLMPKGWPYVILEKSIHYYASLYGLRAILWHQGEDDGNINTNPSSYKADLETVISKSREHSGKNISWMVARVSRSQVGVKEGIKAAQQAVIDINGFNVFQGPDTDGIQPNANLRDDGVHFHSYGLIDLANAWSDYIINENFLSNSKPFLANPLVKSTLEQCRVSYEINASLPTNYSSPIWVWNGGNSKQNSYSKTIISFDQNYGLVKDNNNNYFMSPPFSFTPQPLEIRLSSQPKICDGLNLNLIANTTNNNYKWSTGASTKDILVSQPGNYKISVSSTDVYGCIAKADVDFNLEVLQLPPSPKIEALSSTTFCDGEKVELKQVSSNDFSKVWSTSETSNSINISKSGRYSLQNIDGNGCKSPISNAIDVKVNPLPQKPQIIANGKNQLCVGDSLKLTTNMDVQFIWTYGSNNMSSSSNNFYAKKGGEYAVTAISEFGCKSPISEKISIVELQLPQAPLITLIGKNTICAGDSAIFSTENLAKSYNWFSDNGNIEASISQKLIIKTSRNQASSLKSYRLKITDENDCVSPNSNAITFTTKANPQVPILQKLGPYSLLATTNKTEGSVGFKWFFEDKPLPSTEEFIKVNKSGVYNAMAELTFLTENNNLICISDISKDLIVDLSNEEIILYPNPIQDGNLYIETLTYTQNVNVKIYTVYGQEVFSQQNLDTANRNKIYLGQLKGFYTVEIIKDGKIYTKNILVAN